jgi:cytochrome c oxidase subunit 4
MDAHAHTGGHGKDHVPHVLPLSTYLKTWGALLVLTAVTVGASYVNFGAANLWIALLIASVKAATVALVFMHLYYDHKFHAVIFGVSLIFLGVFIIFTMFDTETRGRADGIERERPADIKAPFAGTQAEQKLKEKHGPPKTTGESAPAH